MDSHLREYENHKLSLADLRSRNIRTLRLIVRASKSNLAEFDHEQQAGDGTLSSLEAIPSINKTKPSMLLPSSLRLLLRIKSVIYLYSPQTNERTIMSILVGRDQHYRKVYHSEDGSENNDKRARSTLIYPSLVGYDGLITGKQTHLVNARSAFDLCYPARVQYIRDMSRSLLDRSIPKLDLDPIPENAVKQDHLVSYVAAVLCRVGPERLILAMNALLLEEVGSMCVEFRGFSHLSVVYFLSLCCTAFDLVGRSW